MEESKDRQSVLMHNISRFMQHMIDRSAGPTNDELQWLKSEDVGGLNDVINRADECLLYPKSEEAYKQSLFNITLAIAILSFCPGGITFWDMHFEAAPWGIIELSVMTENGMWKAKIENGVVKLRES